MARGAQAPSCVLLTWSLWERVVSQAPWVSSWVGLCLVTSWPASRNSTLSTQCPLGENLLSYLLVLCTILSLLIILALARQFPLVYSRWSHLLRISGTLAFLRAVVRGRWDVFGAPVGLCFMLVMFSFVHLLDRYMPWLSFSWLPPDWVTLPHSRFWNKHPHILHQCQFGALGGLKRTGSGWHDVQWRACVCTQRVHIFPSK